MAKNMPTADKGRTVARPAQGKAPVKRATTNLSGQSNPTFPARPTALKSTPHSGGKRIYKDTV